MLRSTTLRREEHRPEAETVSRRAVYIHAGFGTERKSTDNADNKATVTAELTAGQFYGAKIVTGVRISDVTIDYTKEIALIQYVEANGKDISELPYTEELTDLIYHQDYLCAVIVYDETGRACDSAFDTFIAEGNPDGIAEDSSAGSLDDNDPML